MQVNFKIDLSEYFGQDAIEERRQREPKLYDSCVALRNGKPCGAPIKERTTSAVAGSAKCAEHINMGNR